MLQQQAEDWLGHPLSILAPSIHALALVEERIKPHDLNIVLDKARVLAKSSVHLVTDVMIVPESFDERERVTALTFHLCAGDRVISQSLYEVPYYRDGHMASLRLRVPDDLGTALS